MSTQSEVERLALELEMKGLGHLFEDILYDRMEAALHRFNEANSTHMKGLADSKSEWVGLTDEEVFDVWLNETPAPDKVFYQKLCRSVEAKLKEKNTSRGKT